MHMALQKINGTTFQEFQLDYSFHGQNDKTLHRLMTIDDGLVCLLEFLSLINETPAIGFTFLGKINF